MTTRIDAIRARLGAATKGPWEKANPPLKRTILGPPGDDGGQPVLYILGHAHDPNAENDATFIAHAPEDIAYLLSRVEELEAKLAKEVAWHHRNVESLHEQSHPRDLARIAALEAEVARLRQREQDLEAELDEAESIGGVLQDALVAARHTLWQVYCSRHEAVVKECHDKADRALAAVSGSGEGG